MEPVRFDDVPADAGCAAAVSWASRSDITQGTTASTFSPERGCSRGHIVTFLYRCLGPDAAHMGA